MKKYLLILGAVLGIAVFLFAFTNNTVAKVPAKGDKVTICHIPPGNPANAHEITISVNALAAHMAHGDRMGSCKCNPTPPPCEPKPVCEPVCKPVCEPVCQPKPGCDD